MLTAMLAARNLLGESHDVWNVNVERSYHEEFVTKADTPAEAAGVEAQKAAIERELSVTHPPRTVDAEELESKVRAEEAA